jgi:hypothetical protein
MDPQILSQYADQIRFLSNGGAGAGAELTCTVAAAGNVRSFTINAAGSGYSVDDVITANGATFTVLEVNGTGGVTTLEKTTGGSAIVDATALATTVAPSGGTGFKINLVAQFPIDTVTIVDGGTGYITAPVTITGGDGTGGNITTTLTNGVITNKTIVAAGNYRTAPTLTVSAGPPASKSALKALLTTFDATYLDARLLDALGESKASVIIKNDMNAIVDELMADLV